MRPAPDASAWQVFTTFLRLGLTSFGGPVAHLGHFRTEFVERRRWLGEAAYADLVALCQFLPGPASSQVGMARSLCPDAPRRALMLATAVLLIAWPGTVTQLLAIGVAGLLGLLWMRPAADVPHELLPVPVGRRAGAAWLALCLALLAGLPLLVAAFPSPALAMVDAFYRAGALVFGGGHVVLPLLQASVVPSGWVSGEAFLAGYGAVQAVPGPLFSFAAFLGASMQAAPTGWAGGFIGLLAIFAPAFLLVAGALPFWNRLRARPRVRATLMGVNAAVVGLLLAALWDPVITSGIRGVGDALLAALALLALMRWRWPPWVVVAACAGIGWAMAT